MKNIESRKITSMTPGVFVSLARMKKGIEAMGEQVIDLSIGNPDIAPSLDIREAVSQSSLLAWNYSYSLEDMPQLRRAACSWYWARYGVALNPDSEIISTNGSTDALVHMFLAFTDPGDKVLVCNPYCPALMTGIQLAGAEPVFMPLRMENDFLPDLSAISKADANAAKLIIVSYPNNPTTATAPDRFWEKLIAFADKYDILIVNDNSYSDITYDGVTAKSFLSFEGAKETGIELNSLSQTYSMPGLHGAFMVGNEQAIATFAGLKESIDLGLPYPVQYGMIAALTQEQSCVEDIRSVYEERRNVFTDALADIGLPPVPCKGTPYLWIKLPDHIKEDLSFCRELLFRANVLLSPGSFFGSEGIGYVRAALERKSSVLKDAAKAILNSKLL